MLYHGFFITNLSKDMEHELPENDISVRDVTVKICHSTVADNGNQGK